MKTIMEYYYPLIRMTKRCKKLTLPSLNMEEQEFGLQLVAMYNDASTLKNTDSF